MTATALVPGSNRAQLDSQTILVTGANGFVGKTLCALLQQRGYRVRAAVRSAASLNETPGESIVVGDISADTTWPLTDVHAVIHLAARVHVMVDRSANPLEEFRAVNVAATEQLAQQAAATGVHRLIFVSSIKVNGERTSADRGFSETDPPAPVDAYGISKLEAEQALRRISSETGLEITIVRPPLIYGRGVKGNFRAMLNWVNKGIPFPGTPVNNRRSLLGVSNFADLLETCIHAPAASGETFLASDGSAISTYELLRRIANALGKPLITIPIPETALRLALRSLKREGMIDRLFGSLVLDTSHVEQTLHWTPPVSMDDELARIAEWYRATP